MDNIFGRTGLCAGRLGIGSSYKVPARAIEEAFERGCNYLTIGSFLKGYRSGMVEAVNNIVKSGRRDRMVLAVLSYAHMAAITDLTVSRGLRKLGTDYADILILGYFSKRPPQRVLDGAQRMVKKGLVRFIGITTHNRGLVPELANEGVIDIFHVRYNAAHRGAETEVFPFLDKEHSPGIVSFTATRWGELLKANNMPDGEKPLTAAECYRFVLSNPNVDVCMCGPSNEEQMREALSALDGGPLSVDEMERIKKIGDHVRAIKKRF